MIRRQVLLRLGMLTLAAVVSVLVASAVSADVKIRRAPGNGAVKMDLTYQFGNPPGAVITPGPFRGLDPPGFTRGFAATNGIDVLWAYGECIGGVEFTSIRTVGDVIAGGAKGNETATVDSSVIDDELRVAIDRGTPGQIGLTPTGNLRHLGAYYAPMTSIANVAVYNDSTNADAGTNVVAQGTITWSSAGTPTFSGFWSAADFNQMTKAFKNGHGGFEVTPRGNVETVVVANAATAVVVVKLDPTDRKTQVPASGPVALALVAMGLLGGATWFMLRRRTQLG